MGDFSALIAPVISVALGLVLALVLTRPLRAYAPVFYAVALAVVGVYTWAVWEGVDLAGWRWLTFVLQKGYLSSVLLAIVMFTGCLDTPSELRHRLRMVRGELSVLSFIFILGHLAMFLPSYANRLFGGAALKGNVKASIIVAIVLTFIFLVLAVISFRTIRRHMDPKLWKAIQRFAYLMMALYLVHIAFFLGTSALGGSHKGLVSLVVYTVLVLAYAISRVRRAVKDRARSQKEAAA